MSLRERRALTYQGAMTGLFDDFFDKEKISDEEVRTFMELPGNAIPNNSRQQLFLKFYMKALDYSHSPQLTLTYLQKVYQAQVESKKQAAPGKLSREEIKQITIQKGGLSVLLYRM